MADRCYGCTGKYKFREKPIDCPQCRRSFCNKCLDRKRLKEPGYSCVYCSQKQKRANKDEEKDILQNFHERYYKHRQQQQDYSKLSRVPVESKVPHVSSTSPVQAQKRGFLSPEDQELEKRFLRLRQDRITDVPTTAELQEKFNQFQGRDTSETPSSTSSQSNEASPGTKTSFEQAQDLMKQMKEESELDNKLEAQQREQDSEMAARFDALRGRETSTSNSTTNDQGSDESEKVLSSTEGGLVKPVVETDPEKLLHDLQNLASQEERAALQVLGSSDIQSILQKVRPEDEHRPNITYPTLEGETKPNEGENRDTIPEKELRGLIEEGLAENKLEAELKARDDDFISSATDQVSKLMTNSDNESDEEEVKSKPRNKPGAEGGLDFNWRHFETKGATPDFIGLDWFDDEDEEFDEQVHKLLTQMSEEAKLEERLEASGLGHILEEKIQEPKVTPSSVRGAAAAISVREEGDEFPWCCMCNADAAIKCFDCDNDLYCVPCFSQGHEGFQLFDHRYAPLERSSK